MKRKDAMVVILQPELTGLMTRLPVRDGWTRERRDEFIRTFESVLDYVIPTNHKEGTMSEAKQIEPTDPGPGIGYLYTKRYYPCGCKAKGVGDVPSWCPEHGEPLFGNTEPPAP